MQRLFLIPLFIGVFLIGCKDESSSIQNYEGTGIVKAIPESRAHVNVDHEAIDGFMDAMQMFFPVLDSSVLTGVEVADSIRFDLVVENGNYAISAIEVLK